MGHDIYVITREELPGYPEYKIINDRVDDIPVLRVVNNFTKLRKEYFYDYHPRIEEIVENEIRSYRPDLVNIQHLAGASYGVPAAVKRHKLPLVISLHDYWYACERVQLLRPDDTICEGPNEGRNCALYCAHGALSYMAAAAAERVRYALGMIRRLPAEKAALEILAGVQRLALRRRTRRLTGVYGDRYRRLMDGLRGADVLVSPSDKAKEIYVSLGIPADRIVTVPHGMPRMEGAGERAGKDMYDGKRPLVLGYVGNVMAHKGIGVLLAAVKGFKPGRVIMKIYGRSYPKRFASFVEKAAGRFPPGQIQLEGLYRPSDLARILSGLDVLVIPAVWHETFNLVLWEAWGARLPVIASRVGALADFVHDGVDGLAFAPGDWKELRKKIAVFLDDPSMVGKLRGPLPRFPLSLEENAGRYERIFKQLIKNEER
jgi:glycosyltransferase involved in cell wall biosynthesis